MTVKARRATTTVLKEMGSTAVYTPSSGEPFVFLLWKPPNGPLPTIPIDETWDTSAIARHSGYYVYLSAAVTEASASELEEKLRAELPALDTTSFAWAEFVPNERFRLIGTIGLTIEGEGPVVVAADAPLRLPPGVKPFTVPAKLAVSAQWEDNGGFVLTLPPPVDPAAAVGLGIALLGDRSGCITCSAALASTVVGDRSVKSFARVSLDPLRLFDPSRTYVAPTGDRFVLSAVDGGYTFLRVPA